jgi:hypothetical protein
LAELLQLVRLELQALLLQQVQPVLHPEQLEHLLQQAQLERPLQLELPVLRQELVWLQERQEHPSLQVVQAWLLVPVLHPEQVLPLLF